jgi:ubiquinone/menaquinone biosynthesis C-methylase UbiE
MSKDNKDQLKPEVYTHLRGCSPLLCGFLKEHLHITVSDHVLDLGCGPGENTALLAGLSKAQVEGLDLDTERISYARQMNRAIHFHQGNAETMSFADASFSVVTMMLSVQRFSHRDKIFREVGRVLQSCGRVGIATVSPEQLSVRPDFRAFPTALRMECERFPRIVTLRDELSQYGFINIEDQPFREIIRPLDGTFLRWLEHYPFTALTKISQEEFRDGLEAIAHSIHICSSVQLLYDEYTIITATKP